MTTGALADLLTEFGRSTGLGTLTPDEDGVWALAFDDAVVLHFLEEGPGMAVLYATLGTIPYGREAEFHRRMLEATFTGADTGGGSLALDPASGAPLLINRLRVDGLSYPQFEDVIGRQIEAAEAWQRALLTPAEPAQSGAEPGFMGEGIRV